MFLLPLSPTRVSLLIYLYPFRDKDIIVLLKEMLKETSIEIHKQKRLNLYID